MLIETLFLYYGVAILCWMLAFLDIRSGKKISFWLILLIVGYSLFAGFKYSVGSDFQGYLLHYQRVYDGNEYGTYFDEGYLILNRLLARLGVPPVFFFVFLNFIYICTVVFVVKKAFPKALPWAVAIFLMMDYGFSLSTNIYRQYLAVSIVVFSLPTVLLKKKFRWIFVVLCFFAAQFHASAYLGLAYLLLGNREIVNFHNRWGWILCIGILYIIGAYIMPIFDGIVHRIADFVGYGGRSYLDGGFVVEVRGGGVFLKYILSCFAIWYYPIIIKYNKGNKLIALLFNGFVIGSLMKAFFFRDIVVLRTFAPFIVLEYATLGITIAYILQEKNKNILLPAMIMLSYIILFRAYVLGSINWMSPYIPFPDFYG